jgi:hypothetical protein
VPPSPGLVQEGIEQREKSPVAEVVTEVVTEVVAEVVAEVVVRICDSMVSWIESSESGCALLVGPSGCGKTSAVSLAVQRLNAALKSYHPWSAETCGGFEHMIVTASKVGRIGLRAGGSGSGSGDRVRRILLVEYGDLWALRKMAGGGGGNGGGQGGARKNKKYSFESALPSKGTFIVVECQNTRPACLQKLRKGGLANQWRVFEFDRESRDLRESRDRDARGSSLAAAGSIARFRYAPLNRARLMMAGNVLDSEVLSMVEDDRNMHDIMWFNGPLTTVEREGGRSGSSALAEERDLWSEMDAEEGGTRGSSFNSSLPHDVLEAVMFRRQRGCLRSGLDRLTWPTAKHWDALKAGRRHVPPSVDKELTDLLLRGKEQRTLLDERGCGE